MPQVFKIGKRERTVRTVLLLIHCNVLNLSKTPITYIAMYVVRKKTPFPASQCMKFLQNQSML